jgi:acetyl-CoA carboxylase biotin carboxyl carrier protein
VFDQPTEIRAEIVANVLSLSVAIGDLVKAGDSLLLLESMKMEIPVLTDIDGEVIEIPVAAGDFVQVGDLLIRLRAI